MHSLIFILSFMCSSFADQLPLLAKGKGFALDLIHRDSVRLSYYNHSKNSPEKLWREAVFRSFSQVDRFNSSRVDFDKKYKNPVMIRYGADYLIRLFLKNDKNYKILALASTGSDLIWINCDPCKSSYKPKRAPYKPNPSTYRQLPSNDELCDLLKKPRAGKSNQRCIYKYSYQKRGSTSGILSTDNFYFNPTDEDFTKIVFGCSHRTTIKFENIVQGMIGLGRGKLSLISQLVTSNNINPKFSYCLVPRSSITDSTIILGEQNQNFGKRIETPFTYKQSLPFYYLTLTGITIDGESTQGISPFDRDIIIDLGIAMTLLPTYIYNDLATLIKKKIGIEPAPDSGETFKLCFEKLKLDDRMLPPIILQLSGEDLPLKSENMYVDYYDFKCLAIAPYDGISVIGNVAQIDFIVEYDLTYKTVSFTPTDCTNP